MQVLSLENATELTTSVWSFSIVGSTPVEASHTRTDSSSEPETMQVPSLENAAE